MKPKKEKSEEQSNIPPLEFYSREFWDNFYLNRNPNVNNINWYFDITKINMDNFSLDLISKDDDILLLGPGLSSILDYFYDNDYKKISIIDFSEQLIQILSEKYSEDWMIDCYDILDINDESLVKDYNVIIDKGCLDCIISEPKNGQKNFIKAFKNIMELLNEDGIFFYFSTAYDRENLFHPSSKINCEITKIDMNQDMEKQYRQFEKEDNVYYLYTIRKEEEE